MQSSLPSTDHGCLKFFRLLKLQLCWNNLYKVRGGDVGFYCRKPKIAEILLDILNSPK